MRHAIQAVLILLVLMFAGCRDTPPPTNPFLSLGDGAGLSIQHHEVTIAEYRHCIEQGVCEAWALPDMLGGHDRDFIAPSAYDSIRFGRDFIRYAVTSEDDFIEPLKAFADHVRDRESAADAASYPISWITPSEARNYCRWLGGDLPTLEQLRRVYDTFEKGGRFGERAEYRDAMRAGRRETICGTHALPFHDIRVLAEQYGSTLPEGLRQDKTIRLCQTGPSLTGDPTAHPETLFGSLNEWTIRNPDTGAYFAAGGSWLNGFFALEGGFDAEAGDRSRRSIDTGFRCIRGG